RRRHVEDVRRAPLGERVPLLDAEPVLLVDDRDREPFELDAFLDQRVRPDDDVGGPGREPLPLRRRARQEAARDAEPAAELVDREEVLLRERLRRRHQRAAPASLDCAEERVEGDDGLPGADIALEEPLHRLRPPQIAVELGDRLLLVWGEPERERLAIAAEELAGLPERRRDRLGPRRTPT